MPALVFITARPWPKTTQPGRFAGQFVHRDSSSLAMTAARRDTVLGSGPSRAATAAFQATLGLLGLPEGPGGPVRGLPGPALRETGRLKFWCSPALRPSSMTGAAVSPSPSGWWSTRSAGSLVAWRPKHLGVYRFSGRLPECCCRAVPKDVSAWPPAPRSQMAACTAATACRFRAVGPSELKAAETARRHYRRPCEGCGLPDQASGLIGDEHGPAWPLSMLATAPHPPSVLGRPR